MATRNLTIMFTDIKGFTARVSAGSRDDLSKLRTEHDRLLVPVFAYFDGKVIKTIGDAFLVTFESPTDAVLCGVTIQEVLRQHNAWEEDSDRLNVRVAINGGEVTVTEDDVLGEPVNIAARLEAIAEPGEVFFTEAVYLSMNRTEAPSSEVGERTFKGIPYPVRVYKVLAEPQSELGNRLASSVKLTDRGPVIRGMHASAPRAARRWVWVGAAAAIAVVVVALVLMMGPSAADKARRSAEDALANGDAAAALLALDPVLRDHPDDSPLVQLACDAARQHADHLLATVGAAEAFKWLGQQVDAKSYLVALRQSLPLYDARATADAFRGTPANSRSWEPLGELVERYPDRADVPAIAADALVGKVFPHYPFRLYEIALQRGYEDKSGRIPAYCFDVFSRHRPSAGADVGHRILGEFFDDQRVAWARKTLAESADGLLLYHAWYILSDKDDPTLADAYHLQLRDLLDGYKSVEAGAAALRAFRQVTDPAQRKRILALHRYVLDPPAPWAMQHGDIVKQNLEALAAAWGE